MNSPARTAGERRNATREEAIHGEYLLEASYSTEGLRGLQKEGGSSRRESVVRAISSVGGHLDSIHFLPLWTTM
jgi:hypothetical protein